MNAKARTVEEIGSGQSRRSWLRVFGLWVFAALAAFAFFAYVVVRWMERQILTTDNWVALVSPMPKQEVVSTALGSFISTRVINQQNIEARITDALPPKADFLAGPLASQVGTLTTRAAERVVASDGFQTIWEGANRVAMNRLLAEARGQTPPVQARVNERFNVDLSASGGQLRTALGKLGDVIPALQPASAKALDVTADLKARPKRVQQVVRTTDNLYAILPLATVASLLTALALSHRRRLTSIATLTGILSLLLVGLVAVKWLDGYVLDQVRNPGNLSAVEYIFDTVAAGLRADLTKILVGVLIIMAILWAAGPSNWARGVRSWVRVPVDKIQNSSVFRAWRAARIWTARFKYYIWLAALLLILGGLVLLETVTGRTLTNALLLVITTWAGVYIFATPWRELPD